MSKVPLSYYLPAVSRRQSGRKTLENTKGSSFYLPSHVTSEKDQTIFIIPFKLRLCQVSPFKDTIVSLPCFSSILSRLDVRLYTMLACLADVG